MQELINEGRRRDRRETYKLLTWFTVMYLTVIALLGQEVVSCLQSLPNYSAEITIVLISVYIFYFVNKNTHDTVLALVSAVIWGAGVMYFTLIVLLPGIAAIPHTTTFTALNDAANAFNQINYILR